MKYPASAKTNYLLVTTDTETSETVFKMIVGSTVSAVYCSFWNYTNFEESIGNACGGGYEMRSAAIWNAMKNAGLTEKIDHFDGRGLDYAMYGINQAAEQLTGHKCDTISHYIWY